METTTIFKLNIKRILFLTTILILSVMEFETVPNLDCFEIYFESGNKHSKLGLMEISQALPLNYLQFQRRC